MHFSFDDYLERTTDGQFGTCYVTYNVTFGDEYTGEEIGTVQVTGNRDEITDFESAISDEAIDPIAELVIDELSEQYDADIEVYEIEVRRILYRFDLEDGASVFIAVTPDGKAMLVDISAEDHIDIYLDSLLSNGK